MYDFFEIFIWITHLFELHKRTDEIMKNFNLICVIVKAAVSDLGQGHEGASNEYPQHISSWRYKKSIYLISPFTLSYATVKYGQPCLDIKQYSQSSFQYRDHSMTKMFQT